MNRMAAAGAAAIFAAFALGGTDALAVDNFQKLKGSQIRSDSPEWMAKAKIPLREAVEKAASEAPTFRAVSVRPDLRDGRPIASVVLLKGAEFKRIEKPLE